MSKAAIIQAIIGKLEADALILTRAAKAAHEAAIHEDSIARSKYETFGLEASYLAAGQSKRVAEIYAAITVYSNLKLRAFPSPDAEIEITALITLLSVQGVCKKVFIGPVAGGMEVRAEEGSVMVITPQSPLGSELIGKVTGDTVVLSLAGQPEEFWISSTE